MIDHRLSVAASCLQVLGELIHAGELLHVEFDFSNPDTISLTLTLSPSDEITIQLFMESSDFPLDAAVSVFDNVQDYLAENGATRAEARPACRPGHTHPAICQRRDDTLVIVCPSDLGVVRRIA